MQPKVKKNKKQKTIRFITWSHRHPPSKKTFIVGTKGLTWLQNPQIWKKKGGAGFKYLAIELSVSYTTHLFRGTPALDPWIPCFQLPLNSPFPSFLTLSLPTWPRVTLEEAPISLAASPKASQLPSWLWPLDIALLKQIKICSLQVGMRENLEALITMT